MDMYSSEPSHKSELDPVIELLDGALNRIKEMSGASRVADSRELWETYCDVEMAIALSKFAVGYEPMPGSYRRVSVSRKSGLSSLGSEKLQSELALIQSLLFEAKQNFLGGKRQEAIECSRKARDRLKVLILGDRKSPSKRRG